MKKQNIQRNNLQNPQRPVRASQKVDLKHSFLKMLQYGKAYRNYFLLAVLCTVAATVLSLVTPGKLSDLTNQITDSIAFGMDFPAVACTAFILLAAYGMSWLFSVTQSWLMATATQRLSQDLRQRIAGKINRLPMAYFHKTAVGDTLSRMTNDVDTLGQSLGQVVSIFANSMLLLVGSLILMLFTGPAMAAVAVTAGLLGAFLMSKITQRSQPYFVAQQKDLGKLNSYMEEVYTGHTIVKAFHQEEKSAQLFEQLNQNLIRDGFFSQSFSAVMMSVANFIGNLGYVAVCVAGGILAYRGAISIGAIIAFIAYMNYFTQPISALSQVLQTMQSAAAAGDRIVTFLEEPELTEEAGTSAALEAPSGEVTFDHVFFGYHTDVPVIKDFSAEVHPGQKIAIVGLTGAGKTTLVNLLMRFYDFDQGAIRLDGMDIRNLSREQVHNCFSMVLQDTWLFEGTLRENLVFNTSGITDEKLDVVIEAVGLSYFVGTLPDGYDTMLDSTANLSQGQCQQIAIARAMLEKRTSFVIAHRLSTIQNADCIFVLKDGNIVESGAHKELLKKNGFYAELYYSQLEPQTA